MSYNAALYADLKKRLTDWLQVGDGEVVSVPLDLLNRGQDKIISENAWSDMMLTTPLVKISGEERAYQLPSGMATFTIISSDSDEDGKPDKYFYSKARVYNGYNIEDRFTKATGHSHVAIFYIDPPYVPNVYYQKKLEDFTDQVTSDQFSLFPGELLIRAAQSIHIEETGLTGPVMQVLLDSYDKHLENYSAGHNNVNQDLRMEILDYAGRPISTESTSLMGDFDGDGFGLGFDNDVDLGR